MRRFRWRTRSRPRRRWTARTHWIMITRAGTALSALTPSSPFHDHSDGLNGVGAGPRKWPRHGLGDAIVVIWFGSTGRTCGRDAPGSVRPSARSRTASAPGAAVLYPNRSAGRSAEVFHREVRHPSSKGAATTPRLTTRRMALLSLRSRSRPKSPGRAPMASGRAERTGTGLLLSEGRPSSRER